MNSKCQAMFWLLILAAVILGGTVPPASAAYCKWATKDGSEECTPDESQIGTCTAVQMEAMMACAAITRHETCSCHETNIMSCACHQMCTADAGCKWYRAGEPGGLLLKMQDDQSESLPQAVHYGFGIASPIKFASGGSSSIQAFFPVKPHASAFTNSMEQPNPTHLSFQEQLLHAGSCSLQDKCVGFDCSMLFINALACGLTGLEDDTPDETFGKTECEAISNP